MKKYLIEIERYILDLGLPVTDKFNPPATKEEIISALGNLPYLSNGIDSPIQEIIEWHNGTMVNDYESVTTFYSLGSFYLISLQEIIAYMNSPQYDFLERQMMPICESGHGEYLTLDISSKESILNKPVFYRSYNPSLEIYEPYYDNIEAMFLTILECYRQGIYSKDSDGTFFTDFDKEILRAKEMNPSINFWKT